MSTTWGGKTAVLSAMKGLAVSWIFLLAVRTIMVFCTWRHAPAAHDLSMLPIYLVASGLVTFGLTVFLIIPYVFLSGTERLLQQPWRMYVEPAMIAVVSGLLLTHFLHTQAATFRRGLAPLLIFALLTSLASSRFYKRSLRQQFG